MQVTQLLQRAIQGDSQARGELLQATYDQLRSLASARMRDERPDHTLTATALVHEVSLRLLGDQEMRAATRGQFLALAAAAMRNLLVDHARARGRLKRGGGEKRLSLDVNLVVDAAQNEELLELDEALERLRSLDERKSQVVELRYFGGLSIEDTAQALDISPATVKRDWEVARSWLLRELRPESGHVE
ncbi:MAG: sigma-70 family RNA polymerase sigma factor [Planctomycetales bacterium]|nr:sigma-70 family RNA polymerase sigma factor [Planctomycetales bacterium]